MANTGAETLAGAQKPDSSRWCWECRRRRLVCDCARPVCHKCQSAGIVCPGFEDKKPLIWLAPGRVLSRTRKPKTRPNNRRAVVKKAKDVLQSSSREVTPQTIMVMPGYPLRTDMCDLMEAAQYYNTAVYPDLVSNQLSPNPFVVPVLEVFDLPSSLQHALVTMALSHRIYRSVAPMTLSLDISSMSESMPKAWLVRLHYHRGIAIHQMNEYIAKEDTRTTDQTIATVLVFLIGELQQSISNAWRHHANGLMALFELRGGFDELIKSEPLKRSLLAFTLVVVAANTTSPASDQIRVTSSAQIIDLVSELYAMGIYPTLFPCAHYLFLDIISISYLRARGAQSNQSNEDLEFQAQEARTLLDHVNAFSPEQWADTKSPEFEAEWRIVARIYHSAVTLYCISSLQSLGRLPSTPDLQTSRAKHRDRLMILLTEGLASPLLKKSLLWPLIVAGFEACAGSRIERTFVAKHLEEQSRELGTSQPLVARAALQRFWSAGGTSWDDCFDRPYAFLA